jgi:hypothetical protein
MVINLNEQTAPSAPSSGVVTVYSKTDKKLYLKKSDGVEIEIGGAITSDDTLKTIGVTFSGTVNVGDLVAHDGTNYLRATTITLPVGIKTDTDEVTLFGSVTVLTGLTAGRPYYQSGHELTLDPAGQIKIGMAVSATELLLDIDVEGDKISIIPIGVFGGGYATTAVVNTIDYINIVTTGNATDFGDLTQAGRHPGACASFTRGVFAGRYTTARVNTIDYITIATTGNAIDFGDLSTVRYTVGACSSSTRGVFAGGYTGSASNVIDYITIATTGNATDFGDLTQARFSLSACSNTIFGVFGGGDAGSVSNVIDYVTIATTGNATDFGDLTQARYGGCACSNSHGGLY